MQRPPPEKNFPPSCLPNSFVASACLKPDFFIVGAPRSGTTALCNYLRAHPELFISSPKEPTYFGRDLVPKKFAALENYLALFQNTGAARHAGDGSVAYLCSDFAAEEIRAFNADARILIILREPVEMMHSLHLKHYHMGIEPCRTLEAALAAEPERLAGRGVPGGVAAKVIALRNRASYARQVARFLDAFGREQVKVFLFDDFRADTAGVFRETCRFLGVRDDIAPPLEPHNIGRAVKSKGWHEFLTRAPKWAQRIARVLMPSEKVRQRVTRALVRRNESAGKPELLSPELRARLRAEFAGEVAELGRLLGRDLNAWSS